MDSTDFELNLDTPKRNVFVTQLHQRDDENEDVNSYQVVKESADKLLETGINTYQKTLLLKKEVEIEQVDEELRCKREEFRRRMENCMERQVELQKNQQQMKDRVLKFEKFIKENEAKRQRAIQKYHTEMKLKDSKTREYEMLLKQFEELKEKHKKLAQKIKFHKKFEQYLLSVVDNLPENYIEMNDNMVTSLMMRHRTLFDSNNGLIENLLDMQDNIEQMKIQLEEIKQQGNKEKMSINQQLAECQKYQERTEEKNKLTEQTSLLRKGDIREQQANLGSVLMAINNMSEKCLRHGSSSDEMTLQQKLITIQEYILERQDVLRMAAKADHKTEDRHDKSDTGKQKPEKSEKKKSEKQSKG